MEPPGSSKESAAALHGSETVLGKDVLRLEADVYGLMPQPGLGFT